MKSKAERKAWWNRKTEQEKQIQINKWMSSKGKVYSKGSMLIGVTLPTIFTMVERAIDILPWD